MSPRTGRPKSENPKNIDLKVRIDETTNRQLVDYCKTHNITRTEAIRMGIHLILSTK
nr:CopG family transcriptional regulator [Congzhengia minquanensis]